MKVFVAPPPAQTPRPALSAPGLPGLRTGPRPHHSPGWPPCCPHFPGGTRGLAQGHRRGVAGRTPEGGHLLAFLRKQSLSWSPSGPSQCKPEVPAQRSPRPRARPQGGMPPPPEKLSQHGRGPPVPSGALGAGRGALGAGQPWLSTPLGSVCPEPRCPHLRNGRSPACQCRPPAPGSGGPSGPRRGARRAEAQAPPLRRRRSGPVDRRL